MPPKKETSNGSSVAPKTSTANGTANSNKIHDASSTTSSVTSKKRKATKALNGDAGSKKAPRRSARSQPATKNSVEPAALIKFLLSAEAVRFSQPHDEIDAVEEHGGKGYKTYSGGAGELSPFEELMRAVILSRPISHALGVRSVRTLLNDPYHFSTPRVLTDAGFDGIRQALGQARTQHRQKTAEELKNLADVTAKKFGNSDSDTSLGKLRKECGDDNGKVSLD
jgi:hypothetical protein